MQRPPFFNRLEILATAVVAGIAASATIVAATAVIAPSAEQQDEDQDDNPRAASAASTKKIVTTHCVFASFKAFDIVYGSFALLVTSFFTALREQNRRGLMLGLLRRDGMSAIPIALLLPVIHKASPRTVY